MSNHHYGEDMSPEQALRALLQIVRTQADDDGLWFVATRAPEAYLQDNLRRLHTSIEAACEKAGIK